MSRKLFSFCLIASSFILLNGCDSQKRAVKLHFTTPEEGSMIRTGGQLWLKLEVPGGTNNIDSIVYSINDRRVATVQSADSISLRTEDWGFGSTTLSARVFQRGSEEVVRQEVTFVPQPPKFYSYRVINEYPHDALAFTQGLEFHGGYLYESTGQYEGRSSLRQVDLNTGEVLKKINLANKYFGEGLTIVNNKIIQLTWLEKVGFVYDLNSFEKIDEFSYTENKEGWGICFDGERLILSDGSNTLYFLNKDTYHVEERIEVFNHQGPQHNLNELEFIDGLVYANVYQEDIIVMINPETGAVEGEINLLGIYPEKDAIQYDNELNGIAYDRENGRLFITGKKWAKLFEIELVAR